MQHTLSSEEENDLDGDIYFLVRNGELPPDAIHQTTQQKLNSVFLYHVKKGNIDSAEHLLLVGADVHACLNGDPAIVVAADEGFSGMTLMLRRNGALPDEKGRNGDTGAIRAIKKDWARTLLLMCGHRDRSLVASVDIQNNYGESVRSLSREEHMPATRSVLDELGLL